MRSTEDTIRYYVNIMPSYTRLLDICRFSVYIIITEQEFQGLDVDCREYAHELLLKTSTRVSGAYDFYHH